MTARDNCGLDFPLDEESPENSLNQKINQIWDRTWLIERESETQRLFYY